MTSHLAGPTDGPTHEHALVAFSLDEENALLAALVQACPSALVMGTFTTRCMGHVPMDAPDDTPELVQARVESEATLVEALNVAAVRIADAWTGRTS